MDLIAQAMSGMMKLTASPDGTPGRVPMAAADISTGLYATIGILAALNARHTTGCGQMVDFALLDSMLAMMPMETANFFATGRNPPPYHRRETANAAPYQVFATSDGHVTVVAAAQPLWEALLRAIGRPDLNQDERFASPGARIRHLRDAARVPTSPVLTLEEVLTHEHLAARGTAVAPPQGHAAAQKVVAAPIRMAQTPVRVRRAAPAHGEHTAEILAALVAGSPWPEAAHASA
jgi:crotonobetainyl-CoA:carnitine CoA-transferase CaiB-like acyl-CoA transferase